MRSLATLVLLTAFAVSVASAEEITTTAAMVRPTQIEIGRYSADHKRTKVWPREAAENGLGYIDYVKSKFSAKAIPAIRDPDGNIRVLDGHHKLTAVRVIEKEMGVSVPVRIEIVKDYKGWSFAKYAHHLVRDLGKGYFGDRPPRSIVAKVRMLPASFDKLGDNPLRAVTGVVFSESGLEGSWFADYIQFHVGKLMVERGLMDALSSAGLLRNGKLAGDAAGNAKVVALVRDRMFGDSAVMRLLHKSIKPSERNLATAALAAQLGRKPMAAALRTTPRARTRTSEQRVPRPRAAASRKMRRGRALRR